jgi:hypothetical protein
MKALDLETMMFADLAASETRSPLKRAAEHQGRNAKGLNS